MSIVKNRFLTFLIALLCVIPFTLCAYGCDNTSQKEPTQAEKTANAYTYVLEQLKWNNYKAEITESKNYTLNKNLGAGATITTEAEENQINLEVDANNDNFNIYYYKASTTNDDMISVTIKNDALYTYNDDGEDLTVSSLINSNFAEAAVWQQLFEMGLDRFVTIAQNLNKQVLSLEDVENGYKLTASLDLTSLLNKVFNNLKTNEDKQPVVFINQLIKDVFNKDVTFTSLLNEFVQGVTEETTFEDLTSFINKKFGVDLSNELSFVYALLCIDNNQSAEDILSTKILEYFNYSTPEELKISVLNKLDNPNVTLSDIINEDYQDDDLFLIALHDVIDALKDNMEDITKLSADNVKLNWSFVLDNEYKLLTSNIDAICNIKVEDGDVLITQNSQIVVDIKFSNFGQTQVNPPAQVNTASIELNIDLLSYDAAIEEFTQDLSDYAKFTSDLEFKDDLDNVIATYNNETQVITISLDYVRAKYAANEQIVLEAQDAQTLCTYKFVVVVDVR